MSAPTIAATAPRISVGGTDLTPSWMNALRLMRIERGLCIVGRAVLRFNDEGYVLSTQKTFALGAEVTIKSGDTEIFTGLVTGASLEQVASTHPELVVTIDDKGCKLALGTRAQTFLQSSYADVIRALVQKAGLTAGSIDTGGGMSDTHEYLIQNGSDLALIDEMVRRSGRVWYVDTGKLTVADPNTTQGALTLRLTEDIDEFSVRASGLRPAKVTVNGWDATAQTDVSGANTTTPNTADSAFVTDYLGTAAGEKLGTQSAEHSAGEPNPNTIGEATALASALYSDWHTQAIVGRGIGRVNAAIELLTQLTIQDAGPASGTYTVTEVEHLFRRDGFYTRFTAGPLRPSGLVDTLGPAASDAGFTIPGLLTGHVSDIADPDSLGRVKVTFVGAGTTSVDSAWARVVALGGGASRGAVFQPEVGDEVLVGFERGDTRHPVVLGGLYSGTLKIAADDKLIGSDKKIGYRRITSRLGHVIELADGTAETDQHVKLMLTGGSNLLRIGADKCDLEMASGKPLTIKAGDTQFAIDAQGNVTISGNKITIDAKQDLVLQGLNVSMKGQVKSEIQGGAQVDVKSDGMGNVQSSGPLALKGATVAIN